MPRRQFWEVVKDDKAETFEILGKSFDDRPLIDATSEMKNHGMQVRTETIELTVSREEILANYQDIEYTEEPGLYNRLCRELQKRKQLRQAGDRS